MNPFELEDVVYADEPSEYRLLMKLLLFTNTWTSGVVAQHKRILGGFAREINTRSGTMYIQAHLADINMFAIVLHQVRMAALLARKVCNRRFLASIDSALQVLDDAAPNVKDIRDSLVHFDEYLQGKGKLNRNLSGGGMALATKFTQGAPDKNGDVCIAECEVTVQITPDAPNFQLMVGESARAAVALASTVIDACSGSARLISEEVTPDGDRQIVHEFSFYDDVDEWEVLDVLEEYRPS